MKSYQNSTCFKNTYAQEKSILGFSSQLKKIF